MPMIPWENAEFLIRHVASPCLKLAGFHLPITGRLSLLTDSHVNLSLAVQQQQVRQWAALLDVKIVREFTDAEHCAVRAHASSNA